VQQERLAVLKPGRRQEVSDASDVRNLYVHLPFAPRLRLMFYDFVTVVEAGGRTGAYVDAAVADDLGGATKCGRDGGRA